VPLLLILFGAVLVTVAWRGTEHQLAAQLSADFGTGGQFLAWAAAIGVLGAIGYVPQLRTLSNLAMALVIVVLVLRNGGLFTELAAVIDHPPAASPTVPLAAYSGSSTGGAGGTGGGGGPFGLFSGGGGGGVAQYAGTAATIAALA
jgi:uncharacterized membrane protein YgcG